MHGSTTSGFSACQRDQFCGCIHWRCRVQNADTWWRFSIECTTCTPASANPTAAYGSANGKVHWALGSKSLGAYETDGCRACSKSSAAPRPFRVIAFAEACMEAEALYWVRSAFLIRFDSGLSRQASKIKRLSA